MIDLQVFLRDLVRTGGVQQRELAQRTGLSEKHISQMMTGRTHGSLATWQLLLDAAEVTPLKYGRR